MRTAKKKYFHALGRFPDAAKDLFIDAAVHMLAWHRDMRARQRWHPRQEHEQALEDAALLCERLVEAIDRLGRRGVPLEYIKYEWRDAAYFNNVPDRPFPEELRNDLALLTWTLRGHEKERSRGGQPIEGDVELMLRRLAERYHSAFGKPPAFGTNSPFVRFCRDALPDFGFDAPSATTLERIVERR